MKEKSALSRLIMAPWSLHFLASALETRQFRERSVLCDGANQLFILPESYSAWKKTHYVCTSERYVLFQTVWCCPLNVIVDWWVYAYCVFFCPSIRNIVGILDYQYLSIKHLPPAGLKNLLLHFVQLISTYMGAPLLQNHVALSCRRALCQNYLYKPLSHLYVNVYTVIYNLYIQINAQSALCCFYPDSM